VAVGTAPLRSFLAAFALLAVFPSCGSDQQGDVPATGSAPPPGGKGDRIHDIANPESPKKAAHKTKIAVTGAVVIAIDKFDETKKSSGTIYVADLGSTEPYSGISLFNPSFIPGNLRLSVGDTLDLRGEYQENNDVPIQFAKNAFLVQLSNPIGTFRFETALPPPVEIDLNDLSDYAKGRKWLNMLVRVQNVTINRSAFDQVEERIGINLLPSSADKPPKCTEDFPKVPTLVNELTDLADLQTAVKANAADDKDTVIKSLTGVVTFFCNLHIAPRNAADIVL
jgi:hypothetical protein